MSDARTVKPGEPVRYHNEPRRPIRAVSLSDTTSIRAALKEALDRWEHHRGMTNWDRGTDEDGGEMRRIAELRKEFGV